MTTRVMRILLCLLGVSALESAARPARAEEPAALAEARKQFEAGVNLLDDPDGARYEEAFHAFKKAYALSRNPRVLGNIGFCALHLERDGEAIEAYSAYLREATEVEEAERAQIQKDLATLGSTAAAVRVVVKRPTGAYVLVDTRTQTRGPAIENSYPFEGTEVMVRVRPGRHAFRVKLGAEASVPVEVTIEPAAATVVEATFPPPRPPALGARESRSVAGPVVLATAGALGVFAGVASGLLARQSRGEIAASCPEDVCPAAYDLAGERGKAKRFATVADVSFVSGGVLLGGALLWYALLPRSRSGASASAGCAGRGCGLVVQGAF